MEKYRVKGEKQPIINKKEEKQVKKKKIKKKKIPLWCTLCIPFLICIVGVLLAIIVMGIREVMKIIEMGVTTETIGTMTTLATLTATLQQEAISSAGTTSTNQTIKTIFEQLHNINKEKTIYPPSIAGQTCTYKKWTVQTPDTLERIRQNYETNIHQISLYSFCKMMEKEANHIPAVVHAFAGTFTQLFSLTELLTNSSIAIVTKNRESVLAQFYLLTEFERVFLSIAPTTLLTTTTLIPSIHPPNGAIHELAEKLARNESMQHINVENLLKQLTNDIQHIYSSINFSSIATENTQSIFQYAVIVFISVPLSIVILLCLIIAIPIAICCIARSFVRPFKKSLNSSKATFHTYVPKGLLNIVGCERIPDIKVGMLNDSVLTVFFSDIRSFTDISEKMTETQVFQFLNIYLDVVGPVFSEHDGFIDKYIGDGIMGLFTSAKSAAIAALEMQVKIKEMNASFKGHPIFPQIAVGSGMHTGPCVIGIIGESGRMSGTLIGDTVNLASRIEGLTKRYGAKTLVTRDTLAYAYDEEFGDLSDEAFENSFELLRKATVAHFDPDGSPSPLPATPFPSSFTKDDFPSSSSSSYKYRYLGRICPKGKNNPNDVFELLDPRSPSDEAKVISIPLFKEAMKRMYSNEFKRAKDLFLRVLQTSKHDKACKVRIAQCEFYIQQKLSWNGIEVVLEK
mmetsp:Transcript_336/g.612  ORF Transcript_336/g.612 Transcript_336/m.612 type:complete len:683 (-) Transcript_336:35-2083(-)